MKRKRRNGTEIMTDGRTVWVNGPQGGLIGRFSSFGIDVHSAGTDMHCHDCRALPTKGAWRVFVESMAVHHALVVPESFKPAWDKS